jgi:hypothetical protein
MDNPRLCKVGSECVFQRLTCVFLSTVRVEKFKLVTGLSFDHGLPLLKDLEDGVGELVRDGENPRVIRGKIQKRENIPCIAI